MTSKKIITYTDGGSRGNPGPAALGVVIKDVDGTTLEAYGRYIGVDTNNQAEYQAVVSALEKVKAMFGSVAAKNIHVEMRMDSQLVMRQLIGEYRMKNIKLFPHFKKILATKLEFKNVTFHHIPRAENKEADAEVNKTLDAEERRG